MWRRLLFCLFAALPFFFRAPHGDVRNIAAVDGNKWSNPKNIPEVDREIERIAHAGFNTISLGTFKFMPVYFVDYSRTSYPDAQVFDAKETTQHVATLRRNMQKAKQAGITTIISRSYSHYIPYKFWMSRQASFNPGGIYNRYLAEAHQNDMYKSALEGKGIEIGHQQWNNPVYKDFFISSTKEMLRVLPELDGFMNAYAEAAWTLDEQKLKEDQWKSWKDCINYQATDDNFIDYVNTLHQILVEARGPAAFLGIRDWYVDSKILARLNFPLDQFYVAVKYGGYDQPVAAYPPWADSLKAKGIKVINDMLVYDAEHPHPVYWYDATFITGLVGNIYNAGFPGLQYQDFQIKGDDDPDNPIRLLTQATVGSAIRHQPFTRDSALAFLRAYYGKGADALLKSLEYVTDAQACNIKTKPAWFWQGDGLTPGGLSTERYWMFMDNPDAPRGMSFIRQDVVALKAYEQAAVAGPQALKAAEVKWQAMHYLTPIQVMERMQQDAAGAVEKMLEARQLAPPDALHMKELVASAIIHQQLVNRDNAFLKSALAFYASGGQYDGKFNTDQTLVNTGIDGKQECRAELEKQIYYDQLIKALSLKYMPRRRTIRGNNPYDFSKRIAGILGEKLATDHMNIQPELDRLTAIIENR